MKTHLLSLILVISLVFVEADAFWKPSYPQTTMQSFTYAAPSSSPPTPASKSIGRLLAIPGYFRLDMYDPQLGPYSELITKDAQSLTWECQLMAEMACVCSKIDPSTFNWPLPPKDWLVAAVATGFEFFHSDTSATVAVHWKNATVPKCKNAEAWTDANLGTPLKILCDEREISYNSFVTTAPDARAFNATDLGCSFD